MKISLTPDEMLTVLKSLSKNSKQKDDEYERVSHKVQRCISTHLESLSKKEKYDSYKFWIEQEKKKVLKLNVSSSENFDLSKKEE